MKTPMPSMPAARSVRGSLSTVACVLAFFPQYAEADLVALWDFNQTTPYGVAVDARAGLAARILGGAAVTADGAGSSGSPGDRAMAFGVGTHRLHLTDASYFTPVTTSDIISVSYWIKQTVKPATPIAFVAPSVSGARGFQAHTPWSDGTMYFDTGGCCDGTMRTSVNPGADWTVWHHVTLVKNGAAKDIYLDGTLQMSGVNPAPIAGAITELFLGNAPNTGESVNGDMDDVAVYSHALTGADAMNLFSGASPVTLATAPTDSDGDTLPDMWETRFFPGDLTALAGGAADYDSDSLSNVDEVSRGSNPALADSDADGLNDGAETGTGTWVSASNTGTSPTLPDTDSDLLRDGYETNTGIYVSPTSTGTNPHTRDYDGDLIDDGTEVLYGSNPVNSSSTPVTPGVPTLLAWWQFDDVGNAPNPKDTRVGHAGTFLGAADYSNDAEGGTELPGDRALRITAAGGKMRLADAPWVNLATRLDKMTVCYWIKVTSQPGASSCWFTSPSSNNNARGFQAHCPYSNTTVYFDTAGCCLANQRLSGAVGVAWVNQWHHCVLLKDGGNKRVYVDGVQVLSGTGAAPLPQDFTAFTVGADQGAGSILGWLDDFTIFAAALSDQEITDLATRARTPLQIGSATDSDADGLPDLWEFIYFPADLTKLGAVPADFDADGSTDANEFTKDTNPNNPDTDGDTLLDGVETGTGSWVSPGNRGTNPKRADSDSDGLRDDVESRTGVYVSPADTGTDPNVPDTDGDGFRDGYEVPYGSNPNVAASVPFTAGQQFLLAHWPFNDSSNPAIASDAVVGFSGATTGTYSADGGGRSGLAGDRSMSFLPDQAVTIDGSFINLAAPGDAFTISFWQKLNSIRSSSAFWVVSQSAGAFSSYRGIQAHAPWGDFNMYFDHSGCCDPGVHRLAGPLPPIDTTQWHHLAFLKNGPTKQIYVNGVLSVDGLGSIPLVNDLSTLTIGGGPAGYMDGSIDDFAIYAGGLTHAQICRLTAGEPPASVLTAPAAPFEITAVQLMAGDTVRLTWNSTPGCTYRVESSDSLAGGTWSGAASSIPSGGNSTTADVILSPGLRRIFLRVLEQ